MGQPAMQRKYFCCYQSLTCKVGYVSRLPFITFCFWLSTIACCFFRPHIGHLGKLGRERLWCKYLNAVGYWWSRGPGREAVHVLRSVRLDFARALMKARLSTHGTAHFRIVLLLGHGISPFNYSHSVSRSAERRSTQQIQLIHSI
jgi:hypothetical protein